MQAQEGFSIERRDLEEALALGEGLWSAARGGRFLLTGVSGFIGAWLVETLLWANRRLDLRVRITLVARDRARFLAARGHWMSHQELELFEADIVPGPLPSGAYDFMVHGATETNVRLDRPDPERMFMTSVTGTRNMLDIARRQRGTRLLLLSSGAVYGRQPPALTRIAEDTLLAPDTARPSQAYGHGKRAAEFLLATASERGEVTGVSARCFAFSGPYLPLDSGFAVGNFMADALAGRPLRITGDGTPLRSYLYGVDMAWWLWTLLFKGTAGTAYNVGSEAEISIATLAHRVRDIAGDAARQPVDIGKAPDPDLPAERYVPDTSRARTAFSLTETVDLDEGLRRMAAWNRRQASPF